MIELIRYHRVKPQGLVSARNENGLVAVEFKRFNVENGREEDPERCLLTFGELEKRLVELTAETEVVLELLRLKLG